MGESDRVFRQVDATNSLTAWITSDVLRAVVVGIDLASPSPVNLFGYSVSTGSLGVVATHAVSAAVFRNV